ncbi:hypothetical protein YQE_02813, partial [Dendroctonus ponderosae]
MRLPASFTRVSPRAPQSASAPPLGALLWTPPCPATHTIQKKNLKSFSTSCMNVLKSTPIAA